MRGRDELFPRLSTICGEGLWCDRDELLIMKKVSKILKAKFNGPYYRWKVTTTKIQDIYFTQLVYHYTWDPLLTTMVREEFDIIAQRRLKGLISYVRTHLHEQKPRWIKKDLWKLMNDLRETDEAKLI